MANTLRQSDSAAEVEIGKFLDREFYPTNVKNLIRHRDIEQQMSGIDVTFDYLNFANILVDEKAAAHYVNKDIPTFAFEINFLLRTGQLVDGWLFDEKKTTQYYLLAWVWATKEKGFSASDITKLDVIIINRKAIIDMLAQYGVSKNEAEKISTEIRSKGEFGAYHKSYDKPFYFFYSPQLAEKPINIIIKKSALINLSIGRHNINK